MRYALLVLLVCSTAAADEKVDRFLAKSKEHTLWGDEVQPLGTTHQAE